MSIAYGNDLEAVDDAAQRSFKFNADMNKSATSVVDSQQLCGFHSIVIQQTANHRL
jgi:hypothetical protein